MSADRRAHHRRPRAPPPSATSPVDMVRRALLVAPVLIVVGGAHLGRRRRPLGRLRPRRRGRQLPAGRRHARLRPPASRYGLLMGAALFGYLVRLALVGLAVFAVKDPSWVEPVPSASRSSSPTSGSCSGSSATCPPRSPSPASSPAPPRRRVPVILGLEFPPISHVVDWPEFVGERLVGHQQGRPDLLLRRGAHDAALHPRQQEAAGARPGAQNFAEIVGRVHRRADRPADDRAPTGCEVDALPAVAVLLHLLLQHLRDHPVHPDAGQRPASPCRCSWPCSPTSSTTASGFKEHGPDRLPQALLVPPGVPVGPATSWSTPIEFISKFLVRPFSHGGPSLRQHAGRPHPARHLRRALRGPVVAPTWYAIFLPCRSSPSSSSPPSRSWSLPAGLRLHPPRRRLHRRAPMQPRALIAHRHRADSPQFSDDPTQHTRRRGQ